MLNAFLHECEFSLVVRFSGGNLIKWMSRRHRCRDRCLSLECTYLWAGRGPCWETGFPADLLRYQVCALAEEQVGWLVQVGGEGLACYQAQSTFLVKVH